MIRIVLAEDNALLRDGVRRILEAKDDLDLVEVCGSLDELLAAVETHTPDVVVTDIRMPPTGTDEGIRAATELRGTQPQVGVVVLSQYVSPQYAIALLDQGSEGRAYLLKDRVADVDDLVDAIRVVAKGGSVIDPKVVDELVRARSRADRSPLEHLTPREREVLGEMASGKSNAAIAASLILSERAVEKHINSIFSKLHLVEEADVNRRVKAVLLYLAASSLTPAPRSPASVLVAKPPLLAATSRPERSGEVAAERGDDGRGLPPDLLVRELEDHEAEVLELVAPLCVTGPLGIRAVAATAGDLDDDRTRLEAEVDAGQRGAVTTEDSLAGRAGQSGQPDEGEEPSLEVAVASAVDEQLVEEDDAAPAAAS